MLTLRSIRLRVGTFTLEVDYVEVKQGSYTVVLGPSGVGKTMLLEVIAGFRKPERGQILISGEDVTKKPPEKRGIAFVPQNFALFPHMTVFDNIAFGLRVRRVPEDEIRQRVLEIAKALHIEHILYRKPHEISAGEAQRVALARALVVKPRLLLLDEPLSNLDPDSRRDAIELLKKIHDEYKLTVLHVTHNIAEAIMLADYVIYMKSGRVVFTGTLAQFLQSEYAEPYLRELVECERRVGSIRTSLITA